MRDRPRYIDGLRLALAEEMNRDENVVLLGIDIAAGGGVYGATRGLYDRFGPDRVMDTPIAEAGVVGAAVTAKSAAFDPVMLMFKRTRSAVPVFCTVKVRTTVPPAVDAETPRRRKTPPSMRI